jgi:hypothetical protein
MKKVLLLILLFGCEFTQAQVSDTLANTRRKATKQEVKMLALFADSFLNELAILYQKEVVQNSPQKFQPERIALVRSYLLLFENIAQSSEIIAYTQADIATIFGKPDTVMLTNKGTNEIEWMYSSLQTKYVRIQNIKYHMYFRQKILYAVERK